jgi:hypothetical protein
MRSIALVIGAVVVVLAGASPALAVCQPSGAFDVATHEDVAGAIIVWDSIGNLHESADDAASWYPTDSLPLGSSRSATEVCLDDGRCFRIREDRLGIEQATDGSWSTAWAYPEGREQFLERQLPGPCGEGHATLGLEAIIAGPAGSSHDLLVAAGPDGLHSFGPDGWSDGWFGPSASLDARAGDIYLAPEAVAVGLGALALGLWLSMWRGRQDARTQAVVMAVTSATGAAWVLLAAFGNRSFGFVLVVGVIAAVALWIVARRRHVDVAEIVVGAVWGLGIAFALRTVITSHEAVVFAYSLGGFTVLLLVGAWWTGRERAVDRGPKRTWLAVLGAAAIASIGYLLWASSVLESKLLVDALAAAAGIGVLAWALAASPSPTPPS